MQNGFAQAVMEIANTKRLKNGSKAVRGIVTNFNRWTFIELEYPNDNNGKRIVRCYAYRRCYRRSTYR